MGNDTTPRGKNAGRVLVKGLVRGRKTWYYHIVNTN